MPNNGSTKKNDAELSAKACVDPERTPATSFDSPLENAQYKDTRPASISPQDTQPVLERARAVKDKQSAKI